MMARSLHPVKRQTARRAAWRRHLFTGCALGATFGLLAQGERASAQAFNATPVTQSGSVTYNRGTPGTETVTVNTPTAIVGWNINPPSQPGDPYVFLPAGNTATFQNGSGTANFAILNRIFGSGGQPVRFDGNVVSQLSDAITGITGPGGTVIFQNTGGIIVGANAVFDVGNLVLTSLNIVGQEAGYGSFLNSGGGLDFAGVPSPYNQAVEIEAGAEINALAEGSYVVLASPRIIQGGNVYVNGNVGYIAGENASFSVNSGLFDIVLQNGSDNNPTPIIHTGSTGGPASTGAGDPHRIYMITAPYSTGQAVTMLLSGSIGFDEAVSASIENGEIILSSGITVGFGGEPKYAEGNIEITGGTFTSDVFARATRNIIATSQDGDLSFSGDFTAEAYEQVRLGAVNGAVTVDGDVSLTAFGPLDFESGYGGGIDDFGPQPFGIDLQGGTAEITAENGQAVTIAGDATLDASAVGEFEFDDDTDAGDGTGGTVRVSATTGGSIAIGGDLDMTATGTGAVTDYVPDSGGLGQGGTASIQAFSGDIEIAGDLNVNVSGTGSRTNGSTGSGGVGQGGSVNINASGGSISVAGDSVILSRGQGGAVEESDNADATGGAGIGGGLFISASSGNLSLGPTATVDLSGQGGTGPNGGAGIGASFFATASQGTLDMGNIRVLTRGTGGASVDGQNGGAGSGGFVSVVAFGSPGSILAAESIEIISEGQGGAGGVGGTGQGGSMNFVASAGGGEIQFGDTLATSNGFGGAGTATGGAGTGGSVFAGIQESGYGTSSPPGVATFGNTYLGAFGTGGDGPVAGAGTGGSLTVGSAGDGAVTLAALNMIAEGQGGSGAGSDGGDGTGGTANIIAGTGGSIAVTNHLSGTPLISVNGTGGGNNGGGDLVGGAGTGGTLTVRAESGGSIALPQNAGPAGLVRVWARGTGGSAQAAGGTGGTGTGGTINMGVNNGELTGALLSLSAFGLGGSSVNGTAAINGGDGVGGQRLLYANNGGRLAITTAGGVAGGSGGNSSGAGTGGTGSGGVARLDVDGGVVDLVGVLEIISQSTGGTGLGGGDGGNGEGGTAAIRVVNGGSIISSAPGASLRVISLGLGGNGNNLGGDGQGGIVRVETDGASSGSSINATEGVFEAVGVAGNSSGGAGGAGTGGQIEFLTGSAGNDWTFGTFTAAATGFGGIGASGGTGTGGVILIGATGGTLDVTGGLSADASGDGGIGQSGNGGDGQGGVSNIFVQNDGAVSFGSANLRTDGRGGSGTIGGNGTGGIQVNSPLETPSGGAFIAVFGGTVTGGSATLLSQGVGGAGTSGVGGNGQGGSVAISAFNSSTDSIIELGSANLNNSAAGGAGGPGAAGGNAFGGDLIVAEANTLNGTLRANSLTFNSTATGGAGGTGARGGDAFGGFIQVGGTSGEGSGDVNGVFEVVSVTADASATGGAGGANGGAGGNGQGGSASLLSRGGTLSADSVSFVANGAGGASGGVNGVAGAGAGGRVAALLTTRFQTTIGSTNTIGSFTGTASGTGGAAINPGIARHGTGFIEVIGSSATFNSASLTTLGAAAPSIPELAAPVYIRAVGGSLGFTTSLDVNAAQAVNIQPEGGTIALQGTADINSANSIAIAATDAGVVSGGAWNLTAPGAITVGHANRGSGATVDVASLTAIGSDFTAGGGSLTRASATIGVNVDNLATIAGTVVAPDIFIASSDIEIPLLGGGFLGGAGTNEITLSVNPQGQQTVIGGESGSAGYTLTQAEIGRIRTASLEIEASPTSSAPSRPADIVIRDLTLSATPNPAGAAINRLQISVNAGEGAGGIVQVEGALRLENAAATSGIDIIAGERIQVINPSGSIRVLNSAGLPAGSIGMQSANIWSASQEIIDQLVVNPDFEGRNAALLANEGDVEERGYIEAGDILLRVGSTLFVQNSGTEDVFAGITVTQNTLRVEPTSSNVDVYAFGRRINADGTFVTNSDYFREVEFGYGTSAYASSAEFNLCVIATGACPGDPVTPEGPPIPAGPEIIKGPIDEVEESVPPPNPDRQQFVDVSFASESLLEEPVTSGGDSGVWDGEDTDCEPGETCVRDGGGQ